MGNRVPYPPPGFDELPIDERLDYVHSLWDRIAANPEQVQFPDWHRQELEERLANYQANPEEAQPWDEVREELERKLHGPDRKR